MRLAVAVVLAVGCGRVGFATQPDAEHGDATADAANECPAFATFCDGFESGSLSAWSGSSVSAGTSLGVQTAIVHSGRYALVADIPANQPINEIAAAVHAFPEQTTGTFAARVWLYITVSLAQFQVPVTAYDTTAASYVDFNGGTANDWVVTEGNSSTGSNHTSTTPVTLDAWTCVELDVDLDASVPSATLYVEDQLVLTTPLVLAPAFDRLQAGITRNDTAGDIIYVDDVAQATQHIGCQ